MHLRMLFMMALVAVSTVVAYEYGNRATVVESEPVKQLAAPDPRTLIGNNAPSIVNVVVEIQKGNQSRYVYRNGVLRLADAPYHELNIPGDYGVIPQTSTRGNEPLGVVVLTTDPTPPGTLVEARPIALFVAEEAKETRSMVLAVTPADLRYRHVDSISDLPQKDKDATIQFIKNFKNMKGRPVLSVSVEGPDFAKKFITLAMNIHKRLQNQ